MAEKLLMLFIDENKGFRRDYFLEQCSIAAIVCAIYASTKLTIKEALLDDWLAIFLSGYFLDMVAPFALFAFSNAIFSLFAFRVIRLKPILLICSIAGFVWEVIAPRIVPWSIADPIDFIMYMLGGFLYWFAFSKKYTVNHCL